MDVPVRVYEAYANGDYSTIIADSPETARAASEREFTDYFGKPLVWHDPKEKDGRFFQTGSFTAEPYNRVTIVLTDRKVLTAEDVAKEPWE